jgi:hypothetical protein
MKGVGDSEGGCNTIVFGRDHDKVVMKTQVVKTGL